MSVTGVGIFLARTTLGGLQGFHHGSQSSKQLQLIICMFLLSTVPSEYQ